jgi:sensor histidine kinase YesM
VVAFIAITLITGIKQYFGIVENQQSFAKMYFVSVIYTTTMVTIQLLSFKITNTLYPVVSRLSALIHMLFQSSMIFLSFALSVELEKIVYGDCQIPPNIMAIILTVSFVFSLIMNTYYYLNQFYNQSLNSQKLAIESELKTLRAQINPHFLFNTLNSIVALISINPNKAESITEKLAELFRYSLKASKDNLVALEEELTAIKLYLDIEIVRFGKRLSVTYNLDNSIDNIMIPSLSILSLVENSIKHGANKIEGEFGIQINTKAMGNFIHIEVIDSGEGFNNFSYSEIIVKGNGLKNIKERLNLLYKDKAKLLLVDNTASLIIPIKPISQDILNYSNIRVN